MKLKVSSILHFTDGTVLYLEATGLVAVVIFLCCREVQVLNFSLLPLFLCCPVPELNETAPQTFDVHTDKALITLAIELDYEVASWYFLKIIVVDLNASPQHEGMLTIEVRFL